jgi:hypothetical protein
MAQHNTIARDPAAACAAHSRCGSTLQQTCTTDCATIVATVNVLSALRSREVVTEVALRVRAAASACLVASGLLITGAGGAIALADPGQGTGQSDDREGPEDGSGDDSIGDVVRRAFGLNDGNGQKISQPRQGPETRWGNRRAPLQGVGEEEPPRTGTPTKTTVTPKPEDPKDPCDDDPGTGDPPGKPGPNVPQSGGGGGAIEQLPRYKPPSVPDMQLPGELQPAQPGVPGGTAALEAGAGVVAAAAPVGAAVPIALPVIVAPPLGLGIGGGGGGAGAGPRTGPAPDVKSIFAQPPAGRSSPPANVGSNAAVPNASYRIGYTEYLRTAGLPQVAALAVPGLVGIMVLTGAGGLVGYRQAKAGHAVRVGGSARFMR